MSKSSLRSSRSAGAKRLIVGLLVVSVWAALVATATWIILLLAAGKVSEINLWIVTMAMACLGAGWAGACLLWACAWLVRRQQEAALLQRSILAVLSGRAGPQPSESRPATVSNEDPPPAGDPGPLAELLGELRQLNTNLLLTPDQREIKRRDRQTQVADHLVGEVEGALAEGRFSAAESALDQLAGEVPGHPRYGPLAHRLAQARTQAEAEDARAEKQHAENLMSIGSFDQAERVAEELLSKYPAAAEAIALSDSVRRERTAFVAEQRQRLLQEVERHIERRQWRDALSAAKRLLEAYPGCPEADMLSAQIPALEDNARIEEVRDCRDRISDMIQRRRYRLAAELAEDVIVHYPDTQAAKELTEQMDRLRELAAKDKSS